MRATTAWLGLLLAGPAAADEPPAQLIALSASGGWNLQTRQPWAGLDLAFRHDGTRGARFLGGLRGGWAFFDQRPRFDVDAGVMGVLPTEQLIRLGAAVGAQVAIAPWDLPLAVGGDVDGYGRVAILPYGYLTTELGWQRPDATKGAAAWSIGVRLGASASAALVACGDDGSQDCLGSGVAFLGGITGRIRFHEGVFIEANAGPSASLSLGYAFPVGRRGATPSEEEPAPPPSVDAAPVEDVPPSGDAPPGEEPVPSSEPDPAQDATPAEGVEPEAEVGPSDEPAATPEPAPSPPAEDAEPAGDEPKDLYDGFLQSP